MLGQREFPSAGLVPVDDDLRTQPPVEFADNFFSGMITASRPFCVEFSMDGLHCISAHEDNAVRWVDVLSMQHRATLRFPTCGVQRVAFTQSSDRVWVCPVHPLHPHMYLYSATQEAVVGAVHTSPTHVSEWPPVHDAAVGPASMATCPTSDVLAVVRGVAGGPHLQLLHPLVSAPIASCLGGAALRSGVDGNSTKGPAVAGMRHVSWSRDGVSFVVSADTRTTLFDVRKLGNGPFLSLAHRDVFPSSTRGAPGSGVGVGAPPPCVGSYFNSSGDVLLMTSLRGEAVCVDLKVASSHACNNNSCTTSSIGSTSPLVAATYHHGQAALHFAGAVGAIAARYLEPDNAASLVVHPGSTMVHGARHLLVYEGYRRGAPPGAVADVATRKGALCYQVQSRESEAPRALGVNPMLRLVAVGTRGVSWWSVNGAPNK